MEVREFSLNEMSAHWIAGSENAPLCAVVVELGPMFYDAWRMGHASVLAACAHGADALGLDYGRLVNAASTLYRTNPDPDADFFALLLRCAGADPAHAGELFASWQNHRPEISCGCGVIPMLAMLRKRYPLGLMTVGQAGREMNLIDALGLESRFNALYLKPEGSQNWPNLAALRWFESSLAASGAQVAYVAPTSSPVLRDAAELGWLTVGVGEPVEQKHSPDHRICDLLQLEELIEALERRNGELLHAVLVEKRHHV